MNKQEFITKYSITDAAVTDPVCRLIHARAFGEALAEFVNEGFRGVAEVDCEIDSDKSLLVSAEYTAMFFKRLLCAVYGRKYLRIVIRERSDRIAISITSDGELPISRQDENTLTKIARNAGMQMEDIDGRMTLSVVYSDSEEYSVYATDALVGKRIMLAKLCEIFFVNTGA